MPNQIVKRLFENHRLDEGKVGAFYFLGDHILSNAADVRDAEEYGGFVNYSSHWDLWSAFLRKYPDYKYLDYDYFPRGRIVFDKNIHKYILYIDPKLNSRKYLDKIEDEFGLTRSSYVFGEDEHYRSQQPIDDIDPDEIEDDVIFGESLEYRDIY